MTANSPQSTAPVSASSWGPAGWTTRTRSAPLDARTLLLGDWSPVVRDPLDLIRLSFVAGAIVFESIGYKLPSSGTEVSSYSPRGAYTPPPAAPPAPEKKEPEKKEPEKKD